MKKKSENNVCIFFIIFSFKSILVVLHLQNVYLLLLLFFLSCLTSFSFGFSLGSHLLSKFSFMNKFGLKFFILDALQSIKIFSVKLIKFTFNPLDSPFNLRNNHKFQGIDSTVCNFNDSFDCDELGLE